MSKLKAAVVGYGAIGSLHAQAYAQHSEVQLIAIVEPDVEKGKQAEVKFSCKWYEDVQDLIEKETIDIVSICTPEASHCNLGERFAREDIAILMEKPLTPTVKEADELINIIEKTGAFMTVNYILRFDPRFQQLKVMFERGELGDPVTYFARRRGSILGAKFYGKWTDLLISTAIHDIDLMLYLNHTNPVRVFGEKVRRKCDQYGTDDGYMFLIKFEDGAIGSMETSWVLPEKVPAPLDASFHFVGTEGGAQIEGSNHGMSTITSNGFSYPDLTHWPMLNQRLEGDLQRAIYGFVEAVKENRTPPVSVKEARKSLAIVESIHRSIKEERPISITWEAH